MKKNKRKKINIFEAFSGIWSQHQALKNLWIDVNVVGISEWYTDAIIVYWRVHLKLVPQKINRKEIIAFLKGFSLSRNSKNELKTFTWISDDNLSIIYQVIQNFWNLDIRKIKWENLISKDIDLFTYSFPCQDISQQGKQKGFSKNKKTRSWLLWEIERILKEIKNIDKNKLPKYLMMENVKAILNKNFKEDLNAWIKELELLWYKNTKPFIVNSWDLGSAQNRSRVFIFSSLEKELEEFEIRGKNNNWTINDILVKGNNREQFKTNKNIEIVKIYWWTNGGIKKWFLENYSTFNAECYVYYKNWKAPTITASWANSRIKYFEDDWNIYYLNAKEHLLLQWFNENFYNKLKEYWIIDNKIKFLAWNSINVKVLESIFNFYL